MAAALYDETAGTPEGNRGLSAGLVYAWGEHSLADPVFGDYPERFLNLEHAEPGVLLPFRSEGLGDNAAVAELSWAPRWGALWRDTTVDFFTGFHYLADVTYPTDDRLVLDWSLDGVTKSEDVIITQDAERSDVFALVELLADGQEPRALNVPAGEDAPSPGEADPVPPAEQEPVDTPAPVAGEEPGEGTGGRRPTRPRIRSRPGVRFRRARSERSRPSARDSCSWPGGGCAGSDTPDRRVRRGAVDGRPSAAPRSVLSRPERIRWGRCSPRLRSRRCSHRRHCG